MSEVQIHVPSYNEINQARWNLYSTAHLNKWFDSWTLGYTHGSDLLENVSSITVMFVADKDGHPVDMSGKEISMDGIDSLLDLNPLESVLRLCPIPFIIRPPDETKIKYLKEKRWINGESYIYYSQLQPGQKLKEGQEVVERKVANPQFPHQKSTGKFQTKF